MRNELYFYGARMLGFKSGLEVSAVGSRKPSLKHKSVSANVADEGQLCCQDITISGETLLSPSVKR